MSWLGLSLGGQAELALALLAAFAIAALATAAMRRISPRLDFVSRPKGERWSTLPTPMGGGVGLFLALAPGLWLLSPDLLLGASLIHALGLWDDRRALSPPVKLVVQTVAACWVVAAPLERWAPAGQVLLEGPAALAIPLTIAWFVGLANSVNLLDNMDGSAAGVSLVSAAFVFFLAVDRDPTLAAAAAITVGATAGFLLHNFPPARIYMGDAGSLLLGFTLAGLATRIPRDPATPWRNLIVPLFVLGAPVFDTTLVWFTRRAARRPFLQGGRDHTTHRLMALGLSPRRTLAVIYGVAAALGGVGLFVARSDLGWTVPFMVAGGLGLVLLGVLLGDVAVYKTPEGLPVEPRPRSPAFLYAVELAVDVAVLSAAWVAAYALRFDGVPLEHDPRPGAAVAFYLRESALPALPVVIGCKVTALLALGLYRGFWRTIRLQDVLRIAQALTLGSLAVIVVAAVAWRFENYSRGVLALDWVLSLLGVVACRGGLRALRTTLDRLADRPRRALLLGPEALLGLLDPARLRAEHRVELQGALDPGLDPGALAARAREAGAEVVLLGVALPEGDPRLAALLGAGLLPRRLVVDLE